MITDTIPGGLILAAPAKTAEQIEQEAVIARLLGEDPLVPDVGSEEQEPVSLDVMMGEATPFRMRGRIFYAQQPTIRDLRSVLRDMATLQAMQPTDDGEEALSLQVSIGARLFHVKDGADLRPATPDEIEASFPMAQLLIKIAETLRQNGLEASEDKPGE